MSDTWARRRLADLVGSVNAIADGPFGSNLKTEHYAPAGARVVRLQNIGRAEFLDSDRAYISLEHFSQLRRHEAKPGDVVVAALGDGARPAGRACVVPGGLGPALVKADCFRVRLPQSRMLPEWLCLYLNSPSARQQVASLMRGATRPRFTLSMLRSLVVPVPPLAEQRFIAARLTEQLAAVDRARVDGRRQLGETRLVREAVVRHAFGLLDATHRVPLGHLGTLTDGDWILNADYAVDGIRLLQVGDVGSGTLGIKSRRFVSEDRARELGCTLLRPGDILISRMPEPLGRACLLPDLGFPAITAVDVTIFRWRADLVDPDFMVLFLNSAGWLAGVGNQASGATRPRISRKNLERQEVPAPPLSTQRRIAAELRERLGTIDAMTKAIEAQLKAIEALPAALLREAFDGLEAA